MKRKLSLIRIYLTIAIFTLVSLQAESQINKPQLQIPYIKTAPVIDGKLNDPSWQKGTQLSEFINWASDTYIEDAVNVSMYYDEKNLYVAFRNSDLAAAELNKSVNPKGPRDTFLWGRNHVMVGIGNGNISVRLMADPKGTMTDWKDSDISWNGNWQYSASINESDWTAEFSIPLTEFGLTDLHSVNALTLTISRSFPLGQSSQWNGKCILADQSTANFQYGKWPDPVPGKNILTFKAQNPENTTVKLQCELELFPLNEEPEFINQQGQGPSSEFQLKISSAPLYFRSDLSIPAGEQIEGEIPYDLPEEGSYYATLAVKSENGTIIRRSAGYWFSIETNKKNLARLKEKIGESIGAMTRLSNPLADKLKAEAESILADLIKLESDVPAMWKNGKWNELTASVQKTDLEITRNIHKVKWTALNNWKDSYDFGIALTHSVLKLRKDEIYPLPLNDKINISLARNEYESFQLALLPFGRDLKNLSLDISDLKDNNGNTLDKSNIEVSLVEYNNITWRADYVAPKGWHPDPLIPLKSGINISGNDLCRPVWITVHAAAGTKAGDYSGTISVSADGMKSITASINCKVWDIDLPMVSNLKTHSWDEIEYFTDFYNTEEYPLEKYQKFCELLLKNRFNPGSAGINYRSEIPDKKGKYDFSRVEKVLEYCIERGLTRFSVVQMKKGLYTPDEEKKIYKFIEAYARFLKQKGWLDKALVELWDEPTDLEWPYIKERAERLNKIEPDLRLQLFAEGGPYDFFDKSTDKYGLNNLVDIWAPVNIIESPETQANGGEIWTYFATLARESAPNFFIDVPAIYQRSIAWYCWMYGVDGFEHWSSNYFWRNVKGGKPMDQKWPNVPWDSRTYYYFNGEGQLIYPGPDGETYSSVRLENFRDGMEDYEYLFKLKELMLKHASDTANVKFKEYRQLLNPEEYLLYKYPRKIKVTLENTLRYPDEPEIILETRNKIALAIEELQRMK